MSDSLTRLLLRSLGAPPAIRPNIAPVFGMPQNTVVAAPENEFNSRSSVRTRDSDLPSISEMRRSPEGAVSEPRTAVSRTEYPERFVPVIPSPESDAQVTRDANPPPPLWADTADALRRQDFSGRLLQRAPSSSSYPKASNLDPLPAAAPSAEATRLAISVSRTSPEQVDSPRGKTDRPSPHVRGAEPSSEARPVTEQPRQNQQRDRLESSPLGHFPPPLFVSPFPTASAPSTASATSTIQVTIGRIEVRAASPGARASEPARPSSAAMSLEEYQRRRERRGRA